MPNIRDILRSYAAKQATTEQVMRAMAESDEWFVPLPFLAGKLGRLQADSITILSQEATNSPRDLPLFTDKMATARAEGMPLGAFGGGVSGADVFAALSAQDFDKVWVNPGSPNEERWFIESGGFALTDLWARAIRMERALSANPVDPDCDPMLREFPGFMIAVLTPDSMPAMLTNPKNGERYAAIFTTPDRFEIYQEKLSEEERQRVVKVALPGESLFRQLQRFELSGAILNVFSSAPVLIRADRFEGIAKLDGAEA
jgi:hypothetical protein